MRICIKCSVSQPITEFKRADNKTSNICRSCKLIALKEHRQYIRRIVNRWKEIKGCSACGFKGKHYQLDLDHVDPSTKTGKQNHRAFEPNWKLSRVKEELSKCVILCANCHREKTFCNFDHLQTCDSPAHDKN